MAYLFYSISFFVLVIGTGMTYKAIQYLNSSVINQSPVLYLTRSRWLHLLPVPEYIYQRLPSSFAGDMEAGLTSDDFDLSTNMSAGDSRGGLDATAKREILKIMRNRRVDFDEARRIYTEGRFAKNGIGPDGRPRDPKFVSFS